MNHDLDLNSNVTPELVGNRWVFPDGTELPAARGGNGPLEGDGETPAEGTPAEGEGSSDDAPADGETTEGEGTDGQAVTEYALPDGWTDRTDAELSTLHGEVEAEFTRLRDELAAERAEGRPVAFERVQALRSLQARTAEVAAEVARRGELDGTLADTTPAPLPEGAAPAQRVAAAAAERVVRVIGERTPDNGQGDTLGETVADDPAERLASASALWSESRAGIPTAIDWRGQFNANRRERGVRGTPMAPQVTASARIEVNPDELLTDSPTHNERVIARAMRQHREQLAEGFAAGERLAAICDPATILRDAFVCGTTATPLQSVLVNLTADSGNALAYQYRTPTSIAAASAGVGTWTETAQAGLDASDPDTWKPCVPIACPGYLTEEAVEHTACFTVDSWTELSSPEATEDFVQAKDRAFARHTEGWSIAKLDTFLHWFTWDASTGAGSVPEVIEAILTALAQGDYAERLDLNSGYVVAGSPGLLYALTIDENRKAYRTGAAAMEAVQGVVEAATGTQYLQLLDVANTSLDASSAWGDSPFASLPTVGDPAGPSVGGALPRLSTVDYVLRVFDPASLVRWTTGEATFGQQVTLDQARNNQRGMFQRVFGGMMKPGCAPGYRITITGLASDGSRGGFLTPVSELTGS